jgi:hypothetical protein
MDSAIRVFVLNADDLLSGGRRVMRGQRFELEQAVNDEAEGSRELIERGAIGRVADGGGEREGGLEQGLAEALVGGFVNLTPRPGAGPHPRRLLIQPQPRRLSRMEIQIPTVVRGDKKEPLEVR